MRLLFLEPFFGGSHKAFALGLKAHSSHDIQIRSLPAVYWKWRMAGAAFEFLRMIRDLESYDGIIATDMMNLADFILHSDVRVPPVLLYFHENQFTYPVSTHEKSNRFPGAVHISSALAAKKILFNSRYHYDAFFKGAGRYCKKMPDMDISWTMERIMAKSSVLFPGCHLPLPGADVPVQRSYRPMVVWNHRWDYDKNPKDFFAALQVIRKKEIDFSLALLGERYDENIPENFRDARDLFKNHLTVYDFVASRETYFSWLRKGTVVVSTSNQENFGISIVEAAYCGCIPLVPDRLSYPEIIPQAYHDTCLYSSQRDLISKLEAILRYPEKFLALSGSLSREMERFSWQALSESYDKQLEALKFS